MSSSKKLVVNLSETLSNEFNKTLKEDNKKKSQFIQDAIILYIEERNKLKLVENMKKGYIEMSAINLEISEMGCTDEIRNLEEYEVWLTESDLPDDDSEKRRYILC
jgi:Predicted transcriptional regulators containing the CopG/Arc/MetJ DNA-binding domain and a metal-binding domain